jgi:transposase-like protein
MPSPCTVCLRRDRAEIDRRLARERVNLAAVARTFGVGRKALERHRERHLPSQLARVQAAVDAESASPLLAQLAPLYELTLEALAGAQSATLSQIDPANSAQPPASPAAIAAYIDDARRHLGSLTQMCVDAADARQLAPALHGELAARIRAQLAAIGERGQHRAEAEDRS